MTTAYQRPNPTRPHPMVPTAYRGYRLPAGQPRSPFPPMSGMARPATAPPSPMPVRPAVRKSAKVSFQCGYHIVWCTQYRAPVIDEVVGQRLKKIIADVVAEKEAWLVEVKVARNHVYLVVEVSPQLGIHRLVKAMKAASARELRQEFPALRSRLPSLWTNSYHVSTVGSLAPLAMVQQYVEQQPTRESRREEPVSEFTCGASQEPSAR